MKWQQNSGKLVFEKKEKGKKNYIFLFLKGFAIPVHCFMNDVDLLSGSQTLCLLILAKRYSEKVDILMVRQVETERRDTNHHLPQLTLNPSLPVFAVTCY